MMAVMQVDRNLVPTERVGYAWQVIPEPHDSRFAISVQDGWCRVLTVESPDVCLTEVRVELMEPGFGYHFGGYVSWCELSPALMWRSVPFTRTCAGLRGWSTAGNGASKLSSKGVCAGLGVAGTVGKH